MKPIHIFQFITNPVCGRYRLTIPAKYLSQDNQFKVTAFTKLNRETYGALVEQADILVIQRLPYTPQLEKVVHTLNSFGKIVVYEIDDDLFNLPPDSDYLKKAPPDYADRLKRAARLCQAVQCSTNGLANVIREFHPEVQVLENQLDAVPELLPQKTDKNTPVIIGYAAGENHWPDWLTIKDEVNRFAGTTKENCEFRIVGDQKIYDSIETERKKFIPLLSYEDYLRVLQLMDISLIPLAANKFNRSKSDIKFLESAAAGCAVLASQMVYGETVIHEQTGLLFSNGDEFSANLKRLVGNEALRHKLIASAYGYVESERCMAQHTEKWRRVYVDCITRKRGN